MSFIDLKYNSYNISFLDKHQHTPRQELQKMKSKQTGCGPKHNMGYLVSTRGSDGTLAGNYLLWNCLGSDAYIKSQIYRKKNRGFRLYRTHHHLSNGGNVDDTKMGASIITPWLLLQSQSLKKELIFL